MAGADVMSAARLSSGTLYPILLRFEKAGLLESRWESEQPEVLGRPRRRFYRMTAAGEQVAHEALGDLSSININPAYRQA
jgi:DNA-binding PadR family transcriptional regulator